MSIDAGHRFDLRRALGPSTDYEAAAARLGTTARTVMRWLEAGVTWEWADEIAVKLGRHPGDVWPEWFDVALEPSAEELFVLNRAGELFR